jgi:hypothetical protein
MAELLNSTLVTSIFVTIIIRQVILGSYALCFLNRLKGALSPFSQYNIGHREHHDGRQGNDENLHMGVF